MQLLRQVRIGNPVPAQPVDPPAEQVGWTLYPLFTNTELVCDQPCNHRMIGPRNRLSLTYTILGQCIGTVAVCNLLVCKW